MTYDSTSFEDIRPYNDSEVHTVLQRVCEHPSFYRMMSYIYPGISEDEARTRCLSFTTVADFQRDFARQAVRRTLDQTTHSITFGGLQHLDPNQTYLFISNHRDIILDSAILNVILIENGFSTLETAIGNNLLKNKLVEDLTRLNKNFVVVRNAPGREMYENSQKLSHYIRYALKEKKTSVWIAQKEGRTKDGLDKTQPGLLKMLAMHCPEALEACFAELNIVPVAISYEYDPCDYLKIPELVALQNEQRYEKQPDEDMVSIITGLTGNKGRVHLELGKPIDRSELDTLNAVDNTNDKLRELGALIDRHIYRQYKLWPGNYICADLLNGSHEFNGNYTPAEFSAFKQYIDGQIARLPNAGALEKRLLLRMYANPVFTCSPAVTEAQG